MRSSRLMKSNLTSATCGTEDSRGLSGRMIVAAVGSQGIGLRPQPWAMLSRPVGPERTAVSSIISSCERKPRRRPRPPLRPAPIASRGAPPNESSSRSASAARGESSRRSAGAPSEPTTIQSPQGATAGLSEPVAGPTGRENLAQG